MNEEELNKALNANPTENSDEIKLDEFDPIFSNIKPANTVDRYADLKESDPIEGGALGLLGAKWVYDKRRDAARLAKEIAEKNEYKNSINTAMKEIEERIKNQGVYERASQGAKDELTGSTGRARQETYNTESARRAQASKGIDNPFTKQPWGATDAGLLVEPATADELKLKKLQSAKSAQTMEMIKTYLSGPTRTVADYIAKSKLIGALSGGMAGIEGYEAYKA
jgi:hypothetical protein